MLSIQIAVMSAVKREGRSVRSAVRSFTLGVTIRILPGLTRGLIFILRSLTSLLNRIGGVLSAVSKEQEMGLHLHEGEEKSCYIRVRE